MPTNSENEDRQSENGAHVIPPSTVYSQPWWRVTGTNGMPSPVEHINGSATGRAMSQANGDASNKEAHTINAQQSGLNGHNVQEQQHLKHVPSSTPPAMGEHLEPNSQMELVGHSIVRAPLSLSLSKVLMCTGSINRFFFFYFFFLLDCGYAICDMTLIVILLQVLTSYPYPDPHYGGIMAYGAQVGMQVGPCLCLNCSFNLFGSLIFL
ncbi:hypothetical protein CsSME_00011718 [Camellia sinensis var. sinensis]